MGMKKTMGISNIKQNNVLTEFVHIIIISVPVSTQLMGQENKLS